MAGGGEWGVSEGWIGVNALRRAGRNGVRVRVARGLTGALRRGSINIHLRGRGRER